MADINLVESLLCNIGKTVTIFTESGGLSGSGFTGVLAAVGEGSVRLITNIGAAPACPVGSACTEGFPGGLGYGIGYGGYNGYGYGGFGGYGYNGYGWGGYGGGCGGFDFSPSSWLGSVTEIPLCKIVSFVHVAV